MLAPFAPPPIKSLAMALETHLVYNLLCIQIMIQYEFAC